jgi:hypothetical protein
MKPIQETSPMGRYLTIVGKGVPTVVVGPFPEGFNPLSFPLPAGWTVAEAHDTLESATDSADWWNENPM